MSEQNPNPNVVYLASPNGDEYVGPRRWTIRRYLKGVLFGKWWIIGSTVLMGVAGYLVGRFAVNPMRDSYSAQFSYENVAITSNNIGGGTYVDGDYFNYTNLVTTKNIAEVIASDEAFKNLKVDDIAGSLKVEIENYTKDGTTTFTTPNRFTIKANTKFFPSKAVARSFFTAIAESANVKAQAAVKAHRITNAFPAIMADLSFETQLSLINTQRSSVSSEIDGLIDTFGSTGIIDETGRTLADLRSDYNYAFYDNGRDVISFMSDSINVNKWYNYNENDIDGAIANLTQNAEGYKETLRRDCESEKVKREFVDNLKASVGAGYIMTDSDYAALIAGYERELADIALRRLDYMSIFDNMGYATADFKADPTVANVDTIVLSGTKGSQGRLEDLKGGNPTQETLAWKAGNTAFKANIALQKEKLTKAGGLIEETQNAYQYLYSTRRNSVTYFSPTIINEEGHISNVIFAAIGAVAGFAISSLISAAVYINKIDPIIDEKEEATKAKAE